MGIVCFFEGFWRGGHLGVNLAVTGGRGGGHRGHLGVTRKISKETLYNGYR